MRKDLIAIGVSMATQTGTCSRHPARLSVKLGSHWVDFTSHTALQPIARHTVKRLVAACAGRDRLPPDIIISVTCSPSICDPAVTL
ncbi:hypothetical protein GJAV_G00181490 [Gymnothorax javanicus]|nr:hypothetical protein GJAV_G00181490 [Gymnothorax javanicus]